MDLDLMFGGIKRFRSDCIVDFLHVYLSDLTTCERSNADLKGFVGG